MTTETELLTAEKIKTEIAKKLEEQRKEITKLRMPLQAAELRKRIADLMPDDMLYEQAEALGIKLYRTLSCRELDDVIFGEGDVVETYFRENNISDDVAHPEEFREAQMNMFYDFETDWSMDPADEPPTPNIHMAYWDGPIDD